MARVLGMLETFGDVNIALHAGNVYENHFSGSHLARSSGERAGRTN